jgi:hypothetical protein
VDRACCLLDQGAGVGRELRSGTGLELAAHDRQREVDGGEQHAGECRFRLAELDRARPEGLGQRAAVGRGAAPCWVRPVVGREVVGAAEQEACLGGVVAAPVDDVDRGGDAALDAQRRIQCLEEAALKPAGRPQPQLAEQRGAIVEAVIQRPARRAAGG